MLAILGERTGLAPKVLLPDSGSEHGASPVVTPGSPVAKLVPQGRGNYQLLGEIARGGMGVILKGHDTDLGRDVAVKVLDGELARRPEVVQRFVEEAQIGGQLQHPGIVPVYELGLMADERPYFTMKLIKGETLASLLQQRRSPADGRGRMLAIFESVCQTVAYAHSKGVLHRDLKPANVMVGAFGEVQVVDWGLAKVLNRGGVADERRARESLHSVIATVRSGPGSVGSDSIVGSVMGTPAYMAPEQAAGEVEKLDARADVFSLGAILCEILTGRPPYEERGGEPVIAQAAHALLDPARALIEACDADPALKRLCLGCLMPARVARPANAGEVARTLHEFLVSVEERARSAELASAEARVKAAEERRARRLTLALAATVLAAVVLGGGGAWWANRERAKRADQTRATVEAAQGESIELAQRGQPAEALVAAQRALAMAESGGAEAALLERARKFVDKARADLESAEHEAERTAEDQRLLSKLVDLRLQQITTIGDADREKALDADFAQAFRDYGVDLEASDVVPALRRIRERAIDQDVALALDDWGRLRRRVHGARSELAENLLVLAMDLDHDPLRMRMRQAIANGDEAALLELAAPENLPKLGPGSIFVLAAELWGDGAAQRRPRVFNLLAQGLRLNPGDFVLESVAGGCWHQDGNFVASLACRQAAAALRPNDVRARVKLGETEYFLGRLPDARRTLRASLAAAPGDVEASDLLALTELQLGNYPEALAAFAGVQGLETNIGFVADSLAVQFYNGRISREEFTRRILESRDAGSLLTYLYAIVDHPDPAQRDPATALDMLQNEALFLPGNRWRYVVEAIARLEVGDPAGALAAIEHRYQLPWIMVMTPMAYDFLRSVIYSELERDVEARACYERGMVQWQEETVNEPEAWERSDAMRWRRRAENALAK